MLEGPDGEMVFTCITCDHYDGNLLSGSCLCQFSPCNCDIVHSDTIACMRYWSKELEVEIE